VFGGYLDLKAIIQLMAAAAAGRKLIYFTFGDKALGDSLQVSFALYSTPTF